MPLIKTALPLPADVMVRFFKDKVNTTFAIDYEQSLTALRSPQAILNYIANLKLKVVHLSHCEITTDLMHAFATMRDKCEVEPLTKVLANILYFCKYGEILYEEVFDVFGFDQIVDYVTKFSHTVVIQSAFLNSLPLFTITSEGSEPDQERSSNPLVKTIDRKVHPEITANLFNLFTHDHFLIQFLENAVPLEDQIYFEPHFDRNMYQGKSLFGWYAVAQNTYFLLSKHITDSAKTASTRIGLVDLYAQLLGGVEEHAKLAELRDEISRKGGILNYVGANRKEVAEFNRNARKLKKQQRRVSN